MNMASAIIPRDLVAEQLAVDSALLVRYEARGLVRVVREEQVEGYLPGEIRRLWTIVSLHRDLGINLAGIEAILRLRSRMAAVHRQLKHLASELEALSERPLEEEDPDE
jgi:MerR family transcriptional regulator/heat shock protein HspR